MGSAPTLELRRALCDQITAAMESLQGRAVTGTDIHAARKSIKKSRATLRLLRDGMSKATYRRENAALRDAARPLSAARDALILVESLDRLEKLYGRAAKESIPTAFRQSLERDQRESRRAADLDLQAETLMTIRDRIASEHIAEESWKPLARGLRRVYASGRKAMKRASRTPTPERFHEWRKQVKYLWHQLQVLEPLRPRRIGRLADKLHRLSDCLGDDHDFAVLREQVIARPECFTEPGGAAALLAMIERCQRRLRSKAMRVGKRLYRDKPAAFSARFGRYWKLWRRAGVGAQSTQ